MFGRAFGLPVAVVASGLFAAAAAASDPYPFSGYFALEAQGRATTGCAFDILHQSNSGEFAAYLLDKPHWDATGEARFLRYKHGKCAFDANTAVDNCVTLENRIVDISNAKPDRAKITVIDENRVAMRTLGEDDDAEKLANLPPFVFRRCPFGESEIASRLSDTVDGLTRADLLDMARLRDAGLAAEVLRSVTGNVRGPGRN